MSKEKKAQKYESKQLIDELSKMPPMVIETAYLYAINYTLYGEDVTKKWLTAIQKASALEKAYREGYHDALVKDTMPSAQPEIIRCEECKHSEHWYRDKARCFLWHEEGIDVFNDGFCNYAERKEGE